MVERSFIRLKTAEKNPFYIMAVETAIDLLRSAGTFSFDLVLAKTQLDGLRQDGRDPVNWDYVRQIIQKRLSTELIPLAVAYFKAHDAAAPPTQFPKRYVAGIGHARKTAGYAIAEERNNAFVLTMLENKALRAAGTTKARNQLFRVAQQAGVTRLGTPPDEDDEAA
jgi:hypothetical protein